MLLKIYQIMTANTETTTNLCRLVLGLQRYVESNLVTTIVPQIHNYQKIFIEAHMCNDAHLSSVSVSLIDTVSNKIQ